MSHILVAVGAVIQDDKGKILLVKHKRERGGYWQGKWICPGGELELGEQIEDGIKREVKEETNLEIELVKPLVPFDRIVTTNEPKGLKNRNKSIASSTFAAKPQTSLHVIYIDYIAKLVGGELKVASDVGEALWVEKTDISKIWQQLHEDTQRLLRIAGIA